MSSYVNDPYGIRTESTMTPPPSETEGSMVTPAAHDAATSVAGPASDVKDTAAEAGADVARTAKDEAVAVVDEATYQGRRLFDEGIGELRSQVVVVQGKLADTVQALSEELRAMASSPEANGPLTDLVDQGRDLSERAAAWLRDNDPDQALVGVRRYAARNPWMFLALAGGAGVLAGRFARGLSGAADRQQGVRSRERDSGAGFAEPTDFARPLNTADDVFGVPDDLSSRTVPRPADVPGGRFG